MSDVLEILKRGDSGFEALLRAVLLDSDNKVPADRLRIVGALSAGAIIESGANANGNYVKFADGTLLAARTITQLDNVEHNVVINGLYKYMITVTFPVAFYSNVRVISDVGINYGGEGWSSVDSCTSTQVVIRHFTPAVVNETNLLGYCLAIGRWKA